MNKEFPLEYIRRRGLVFDVSHDTNRDIEISDIKLDKVKEDMFVAFYSGFIDHEVKAFALTGEAAKNVKSASILAGKNIQEFSKKTSQVVNDAGRDVVKNLVNVGDGLEKALSNAGEHAGKNISQMNNDVSQSAKDIGDTLVHGVNGIVSGIKKKKHE